MKKLWLRCVNAKGTKLLREGVKYLVEPRGNKVKVIISEHNPNFKHGNLVNKDRFASIKKKDKTIEQQLKLEL